MGNTNTDTLHIDFETRSQVDLKTAGFTTTLAISAQKC
jgi:hypothetical protein